MPRSFLLWVLPLSLVTVLSGCDKPAAPVESIRPALVEHPQPATGRLAAYPGEVRARVEVELAFRIPGKVSRRLVDAGDRVRRGQPLAELDAEDVRLQLEAARAQLSAAEAAVTLARSERERYRTLLGRQLVSQSQFDASDNQYRSSEAQLRQARAELKVAANQTDYAVLRAPEDGLIASRSGEVGQVVAAGQALFTLAAEGEREVLISVPEQVLGQLRLGQQARIELWSQPGEQFAGRIRELSQVADAQSRTFAVRVAFVEGQSRVEVGQSARVLIDNSSGTRLTLPLAALSAEQGVAFVWVVDPARLQVQRRQVQVASYGQERATLSAGLERGDWVVTAGVHVLLDGQSVRPVDRDNRPLQLTGED